MEDLFANSSNPTKKQEPLVIEKEYTAEEKKAQLDFEDALSQGKIDNALKIQEAFPNVDYTKSIQKAFESFLYKKQIYQLELALKLKEIFPNIDFTELTQKAFEYNLFKDYENNALQIKEAFPNVDYSKKEAIEVIQKYFENVLSQGKIDYALEIQEAFPNVDYTEQIQKGFENVLSQGKVDDASKIKETFPNVDYSKKEAIEVIQKAFESFLYKKEIYQLELALKFKEIFPSIDFTELTQKAFEYNLFKDYQNNALRIKEAFPNVDYSKKEAIESIQQIFKNSLSGGGINYAIRIKEAFPNVDYSKQEITESIQKAFENKLFQGNISYAVRTKEAFPNVDYSKKEAIESIQKGFESALSQGKIDDALKLKIQETFPNVDYTESIQKAFENILSPFSIKSVGINNDYQNLLSPRSTGKVLEMKEKFPNVDYSKKEVMEAIQKCFKDNLSPFTINDALKIKEAFPNVDFTEQIQKGFKSALFQGEIDNALEIKEIFPKVDYTESIQKGFENVLSQGEIDNASKIKETFPKVDYTETIQKGFEKLLSEKNFDTVLLILKNFKISNALEIINSNIEIQNYIDNLKSEFPDILNNKEKNPEYLLRLCQNEKNFLYAIEKKAEYPWLADAILGNERFSDKLILQFKKFDKHSIKNIDLLFRAKENIIQNNSIDENSAEFRILMQEALKEYKNNPKILEYIKSIGVDTDSWLSYDKEEHIKLGKGEDLTFADMVKTPVLRMEETFKIYKDSFKEIFGEYQKQLQEYKIPLESINEIVKSIDEMNTRIQEAQAKGEDEIKIQGMKKGLETLEARKNNPKEVPLWQKVLSDFDAIVVVSNDILKLHKLLEDNEAKFKILNDKEKLEEQERKEFFNYKKVISKSINEFKDKLNILEKRMLVFNENLPSLLQLALGEDRTLSLMQEFKESTHEVLDHLSSDMSSSKNSLEQVLKDQENNKLEGRFIKIGVWGRNPDRDLYLGNYTNCCIRIDSQHMDKESTIADYLTDVGMQVVTINDEITNEPIVAAWVYIGEDYNHKPKMVVDNIEANTDYIKYFDTFKKGLENYFAEYADKTGIGRENLSQGENNNDITLGIEVGDLYFKAGGYNRKSGYFLEAEPDDQEEYEEDYNDDEDYENQEE